MGDLSPMHSLPDKGLQPLGGGSLGESFAVHLLSGVLGFYKGEPAALGLEGSDRKRIEQVNSNSSPTPYMCADVYMCSRIHVPMEARGHPWAVFLRSCLATLFFQTASPIGLELVVWVRLVWPASPRDPPVSTFPQGYTIMLFFFFKVGAGD